MKRFVWNEKYIKMLSKMQSTDWTIDKLARETGVHAGQLRAVVYHLNRGGFVKLVQEKNVFKLSLTPVGSAVTEKLLEAQSIAKNGLPKPKGKPGRPEKEMSKEEKEAEKYMEEKEKGKVRVKPEIKKAHQEE